MAQIYADGTLIHDPNVDGLELLAATCTLRVDRAGTAEIVMPASHPAFNSFVARRTEVTIYRADKLLFRGRALYTSDNFDMYRTVTCEGERGFLRDAVLQPFVYKADPRVIFSDIIRQYNAQVDAFKRFEVGSVTVTDPNNYITFSREDAQLVSDAIDSLVERVGGYITFSTDSSGRRVINWLESLDKLSKQSIVFGDNLLDYARVESDDNFATVLYPYGKKDEDTGERVSIEAVNDGKPYIVNEKAVAVHGWVAAPVYWDNITLASNLKAKAEKELAVRSQIIASLELTAIDYDIDGMTPGENVPILSEPHGVDGLFLLRERTYDLLDQSQDTVVLGKDTVTLTRSTAAAGKNTADQQTVQSGGDTYIVEGGGSGSSGPHASTHATGGADPLTCDDIGAASAETLTSHTDDKSNPHGVTCAQIGALGTDGTAYKAARLNSDTIKLVSTATTVTLEANGYISQQTITPTAVSGYTLLAPVHLSSDSSYTLCYHLYYAGGKLGFSVRNLRNAEVTANITVYALYVKTS